MLRHQAVPASLHFRRLNPHIDLGGAPVAVPTTLTPLALGCVGVSSFGFSGTNAHVVLERAAGSTASPDARQRQPGDTQVHRLLISARSPEALNELVARYRSLLDTGVPFADVCHSAAAGRARLPWWVCVDSPAALADAEASDAPPPDIPAQSGRRIDLPLYPFERQRHWLDDSERLPGRRVVHAGEAPLFEAELQPNAPLLADHRVRGERLLPAADMLERLRSAAEITGQGGALRDVTFDRALVVSSPRTIQVTAGDPLVLFARKGEGWQRHAAAFSATAEPLDAVDLAALRAACPEPIAPDDFAAWLRETGLRHGPFYDCITVLARGSGQAIARLRPAPYVALLDAAFRIAGAIAFGSGGAARLPAGVARYDRVSSNVGSDLWAHVALIEDGPGVSVVDVRLLDGGGATLARVEGLRLAAAATTETWRQWLHVTEWVPSPSPAALCADAIAALGDTAALTRALDAAASGYARRALATVTEADVAPGCLRLWRHLLRLAAKPTADSVPDGPEGSLLARCGAALPDVLRGVIDPMSLLLADEAAGGASHDAPIIHVANSSSPHLPPPPCRPPDRCVSWRSVPAPAATTQAVLTGSIRAAPSIGSPTPTLGTFSGRQAALPPTAASRSMWNAHRRNRPIPEHSFDLVLAANVLHATADIGAALDHTLRTLAKDGRLLLLEAAPSGDPPSSWIDLVLGLTRGGGVSPILPCGRTVRCSPLPDGSRCWSRVASRSKPGRCPAIRSRWPAVASSGVCIATLVGQRQSVAPRCSRPSRTSGRRSAVWSCSPPVRSDRPSLIRPRRRFGA